MRNPRDDYWHKEDTGHDRLRNANSEEGGFFDFFPDPREIVRNVLPSAGRAAMGVVDFFGLGGAESRKRSAQMRQGLGEAIPGVAAELWRSAMDPDAGLLTHLSQSEDYPYLSSIGAATPFGPEGWRGFVRNIEQEPAEWIFDIGLSATGAGAGAVAARRASRILPDTPMKQFARQWSEVEVSSGGRLPSIDAPETHGGGRAIDWDEVNAEASFLADEEFFDIVPDIPVQAPRYSIHGIMRPQTSVYNYDLQGSYSGMDWTPPPRVIDRGWGAGAASKAQLDALKRQYPDRDYTGITKKEASNILSFEFHEAIYEGDAVDYQKAAALGIDLHDPRSAVAAQSWQAPEYVQSPNVLEWLQSQRPRPEGYEPIYNLLHRGDDVDARTSAQFSIYGNPAPLPQFGPHPRSGFGSDYHSGEISADRFSLGAKELGIGAGISVGVGGAVYGWQNYFGGEPAYVQPTIPHLSEVEREQALREIEGGGAATEKQIVALQRMYPDRDLSGITKSEASQLFDDFTPGPKMATEKQVAALQKMYPDREFDDLTMEQASELFSSFKRPVRSNEASEGQLNYLNQLRGGGGGFGDVMPIEDVDESDGLTSREVSTLIDFEKARRKSEAAGREAQGPAMASQGQLEYLAKLNPERYGGLVKTEDVVMGIEDVTFEDGLTRAEAATLFDYENAVRKSKEISEGAGGPAMASTAQVAALRRIFPDQFGQEPEKEVEAANYLNVNISDGITRQEAAHLFKSAEVARGMQGPEMASQSQISALRKIYPDKIGDVPEEPLTPLEQINLADGVTKEEARLAFQHVPESPPPMATKRQVAKLEAEFPHAFKDLGDVEAYLASGQSYGIVQSLEDIYDADTFTGRLYDAETGQTLKEDTVRLGDFNAPEIKPDQFKPKEYQLREAARARQARDVFRSMVERYNIGRDVENEGYVIPIQYRQDAGMPGGLERGFYGRVLGDVNFEGIDYEQFMIQQGMGSVYGANVEWGAEEIDPAMLWRRAPTYTQQLGDAASKALWDIPGNLVGGLLEGGDFADTLGGTLRGTASGLKDTAISQAKQTAVRATTDWFKETFTDDFTPSNLGFVERYVGDLGGLGGKAGNFLQSGVGSALGALALAAGTFYVGEKSLDAGYEEVVASKRDREGDFYEQFRTVQRGRGGEKMKGNENLLLAQIERMLRRVLKETGGRSFSKEVTRIGRQSKINSSRGLT